MAVIHHLRSPKSVPKRLKLSIKETTISTPTRRKATAPISLPPPILEKIYSLLAHPRTQIAFSLTCHTFAHIASKSSTHVKPGLISTHGRLEVYDKEHLLKDLVEWGFITLTPKPDVRLQLCCVCWKYLPQQRIWRTKDGRLLSTLKKVDWGFAVMAWMHGGQEDAAGNGDGSIQGVAKGQRKGLVCPTCQIPEGYDDAVPGRFLQAWDSGFAPGRLRLQEYEAAKDETSDEIASKKEKAEASEEKENNKVKGTRTKIVLRMRC